MKVSKAVQHAFYLFTMKRTTMNQFDLYFQAFSPGKIEALVALVHILMSFRVLALCYSFSMIVAMRELYLWKEESTQSALM
mmetsp:Transcript_128388/g.251475  ORF Transcript_128388/g.251475 Transcript_128388/m.251475 type:complete len:81 (+) Transcript_128388:597-839(+)